MVSRYPDTITVKTLTKPSSDQDSSGNWNAPTSISVTFDGRYRANTTSNVITLSNGETTGYSGIIYADYSIEDVQLGATVSVTGEDGKQKASGKVKQFVRSQRNVKLWL